MLDRRAFIRVVVAGGAGIMLPAGLGAAPPRQSALRFPQSVASGDPRPESVVLWSRLEPPTPGDHDLVVEVATSIKFEPSERVAAAIVPALEQYDHTVRVKVTGLTPDRRYYYRFLYGSEASPIGRTRSAPLPDADRPAAFAYISCQDFGGRYYNTLLRLLRPELDNLDFVVHLGDYIYETGRAADGGPAARTVTFSRPEEALALGGATLAARSLHNYRELYRTFRSDPTLQKVHERFPLIPIWDDHEFSNDSWQDHGSYFDGRQVEQDRERRENADQVYFEYMPVDPDDLPAGPLPPDGTFPRRLYRRFRYGRHLNLTMTDYRSFRPDHLIPEDAFPGRIVMEQAAVVRTVARLLSTPAATSEWLYDSWFQSEFRPYVPLDDPALQPYHDALYALLLSRYLAEGLGSEAAAAKAAADAGGPTDLIVLNEMLAAAGSALPPLDAAGRPRGMSYALLGKLSSFSLAGSRYVVVKPMFDLYGLYLTEIVGEHERDDAYGAAQGAFLAASLADSATWQVVANSTSFTSMILDFATPPPPLAALLERLPGAVARRRYYLNVDQWDGFGHRRAALLEQHLRPANAVLISGDIHAAFATDHGTNGSGGRAVEFTTPAVSSATMQEILLSVLEDLLPGVPPALLQALVRLFDLLFPSANPGILYSNSAHHGLVVMRAASTRLTATYHLLPVNLVHLSHYEDPAAIEAAWRRRTFVVERQDGVNRAPRREES